MAIITCRDLTLHFGNSCILDHTNLDIEAGDRLCLTGRNGSGKTTLLKILAGSIEPDSGAIWRDPGLVIGNLDQSLPDRDDCSVYDAVAQGFSEAGALLIRHHHLLSDARTASPAAQAELSRLHQQIDHADAWNLDYKINAILDQMSLPAATPLAQLSGGWLRRVAIARALVTEPNVLLLDEPTNHLDIPAIEWLEALLQDFAGTLIFVSHDRRLMSTLATSIVDLEFGRLNRWDCNYATFLERKELQIEAQSKQEAREDDKLSREEAWLRQGIKARGTRNQGRLRALYKLREERRARNRQGSLKVAIDAGSRSGSVVKELRGVSKSYSGQKLIENLDLTIRRGDRLGLLGPNGCGKSTLLRMLLDGEAPDGGTISSGTRLQVAYFDQIRGQLDPNKSVADSIADGREYVSVKGENIHVVTYLGNFMFSPEHARSKVRVLSGGEQNRLLLAKLFSLPANLLVLDEPTNDLDIQSLELLEERLLEYDGTVLLVTHDRTFLDNVVTSVLVFEGDGVATEYVGGYSDWREAGHDFARIELPGSQPQPADAVVKINHDARRQSRKAVQQQAKELERVTVDIERTEAKIARLHAEMAQPGFYDGPSDNRDACIDALARAEATLATLYGRWEALESTD